MRVLITPEWYPWPDRPVYGVFCREQAQAVARIEDVVVLTWRVDPTLRVPFRLEMADEEGLYTIRVHVARPPVAKANFGFRLTGCMAALAHLRGRGWAPDVIHAHHYVAGRVALSLGALTGTPVIFSEHYSGFALGTLSQRERRRAKWAFERASLVCPVSRDLTRHVQAVAPAANLEPIPNVVDTDVFALGAASGPDSPPRLVTVGSLVEIKGHRHLITALAGLRECGRSVTLDVIGDGPLRPELEQLARDSGVDDLIRFRGLRPKEGVAAALRGADVFVLASLWETLSCAVLEAMSTGLPIVATRVGGLPEVVGRREGILVAPGSSDALLDGFGEMVRTVADYDRAHLHAKAVEGFGYAAIASRWANVYASAADHHVGWRRLFGNRT